MSMQDPPLPFPSLSCPYSFRQSTSVTYLHEAGTKWKFVAALLIAMDGVPAPSQLPTPPATLSTYLPPPPPLSVSHVCVLVAILMCQVFYLRVLPTLILFAHLPGKSARKLANSIKEGGRGRGSKLWEGSIVGAVGGAVPSRLAFMFNSCANCRGNLASSVLNAVRCFWFMAQLVPASIAATPPTPNAHQSNTPTQPYFYSSSIGSRPSISLAKWNCYPRLIYVRNSSIFPA